MRGYRFGHANYRYIFDINKSNLIYADLNFSASSISVLSSREQLFLHSVQEVSIIRNKLSFSKHPEEYYETNIYNCLIVHGRIYRLAMCVQIKNIKKRFLCAKFYSSKYRNLSEVKLSLFVYTIHKLDRIKYLEVEFHEISVTKLRR